jgi:hypothetical protein
VRLLWGLISDSPEYVRPVVTSNVWRFALRLSDFLKDPQAELLLLRACVGVCRLVHLLRCTPPSLVDQGAEIFDATLQAALRRITVGEGKKKNTILLVQLALAWISLQ